MIPGMMGMQPWFGHHQFNQVSNNFNSKLGSRGGYRGYGDCAHPILAPPLVSSPS